ncbi:Ser/Thr protein kinase RdoA (MazF antagonist) [Kribbella orskensis]|uniref:Ser/Thr protein kinase RdoA (MazF antagonist) n=1 Tax=Kribbella orskensis TaxID=2512216 RepID=A0ABY2BPG7_9ACTN|nr:Ser/Thr protein kinase RdoA (MazF antagonist) [Kribbella sp. VKM Ac-2500]TCO27350.1 Ser/Thr protein kinase RdoA (MazF antagonist) [Kribbella orskensis]
MTHTHHLSTNDQVVTKTYASWSRNEPAREWAALQTIAAAAPTLVPTPLSLSPDEPSLTMSRLPGRPLSGALTPEELAGLEAALRTLWSIPPEDLSPFDLSAFIARTRAGVSAYQGSGIVAEAHAAATDWLSGPPVDLLFEAARPVIGHGDPNLANYLWDGERVRIVDFEDAGRSDLAVELANLVEHISTRATDWTTFVNRFPIDRHRHLTARRLWSIFWLTLLRPGAPSAARNPPDIPTQQALRVLQLLSTT